MYTDKNCLSVPPEPLRAAMAARGVRIENARLAVLEDLVVPRDTSILPVCSDVSAVPDGAQIYVSNSVGKTVVLPLDAIRAQPALVCALVPTLSLEEDISIEDLTDSVNAILEENMPVALSNFSRTPIVDEQFTLFVRKYVKDQAEATYYAIAEIKSVSDTGATFTISRLVAEIAKTLTQTEVDLADAVAKKHEHTNKAVIDDITAENVTVWGAAEQNAKDYVDTKLT